MFLPVEAAQIEEKFYDCTFDCVKPEFLVFYQKWREIIDQENQVLRYTACDPTDGESSDRRIEQLLEKKQSDDLISELQTCSNYVALALESLKRSHMKVAFIGRTSQGKSTLINAFIGQRLLPSSQGHTTDCFIELIGVVGALDDESDKIEIVRKEDDGSDPDIFTFNQMSWLNNVDEAANYLEQMVSSLVKYKIEPMKEQVGSRVNNHLITVKLPSSQCQLLREDLVLMDCPGLCFSQISDEWLKERYKGADMFVLVVANDGTITEPEKLALKKLHDLFDIRELCIANTRWEKAAECPEEQFFSRPGDLDKRRDIRQELCKTLLVDYLKISTLDEAEQKIFFVSGLEELLISLGRRKEIRDSDDVKIDERQKHFHKLKKTVIQTASENGLKKKLLAVGPRSAQFKKHYHKCIEILELYMAAMESLKHKLQLEKKQYENALKECDAEDKLRTFSNELDSLMTARVAEVILGVDKKLTGIGKDIEDYNPSSKYNRKNYDDFCTSLRKALHDKDKMYYKPELQKLLQLQVHAFRNDLKEKAVFAYCEFGSSEKTQKAIYNKLKCDFDSPHLDDFCTYDRWNHLTRVLSSNKIVTFLSAAGGGGLGLASTETVVASFGSLAAFPLAVPCALFAGGTFVAGSAWSVFKIWSDINLEGQTMIENAFQSYKVWLRNECINEATRAMKESKKNLLNSLDDYNANLITKIGQIDQKLKLLQKPMDEVDDIRQQLRVFYSEFSNYSDKYISRQ